MWLISRAAAHGGIGGIDRRAEQWIDRRAEQWKNPYKMGIE